MNRYSRAKVLLGILHHDWCKLFVTLAFVVIVAIIPLTTDTIGGDLEMNAETIAWTKILDVNRLRSTVGHLQGYENRSTWESQWKTARWIADQFESLGIETIIQTYEFKEKNWPNVTAKLPGREKQSEVIMLIAHLDSISHNPHLIAPGADDNASGVAVILEIARVIRSIPLRRSIMFAVLSNEERGTAGSKAFVKQAIKEGLDIQAVVNLDVLGYNRPSWPLYIDAITSHFKFKHKLKALYRMFRNFIYGLFFGKDVIKVAGKNANATLVKATTESIRRYTNLKVKPLIGEDCG